MKADNHSPYEGPRTPREEEWEAVCELSRSIFFKDAESYAQALRSWPMVLYPDVRQNDLTIFREGRPVSTIKRLERDLLVYGHRLRMGFIGGVCTHPGHRGKGLAGTILSAMMRQFHQDDVDFVYISGARGLYFRAGAGHVSIETRFMLDKNSLTPNGLEVQLRPAALGDVDLLVTIAERESVRLIRPRTDFELVMENAHCAGHPCAFHLVELEGIPVAYLLARNDEHGKPLKMIELAGDRLSILSALSTVLQELEGEASLEVNLPHGDVLIDLLWAADARSTSAKTGGTMKVIDMARTMRKLLPYFQERLPGWPCWDLNFAVGDGRYVVWDEEGILQLESENNVLWMLLGKPPDAQMEGMRVVGRMQELLKRCLPIPVPFLSMNVI